MNWLVNYYRARSLQLYYTSVKELTAEFDYTSRVKVYVLTANGREACSFLREPDCFERDPSPLARTRPELTFSFLGATMTAAGARFPFPKTLPSQLIVPLYLRRRLVKARNVKEPMFYTYTNAPLSAVSAMTRRDSDKRHNPCFTRSMLRIGAGRWIMSPLTSTRDIDFALRLW